MPEGTGQVVNPVNTGILAPAQNGALAPRRRGTIEAARPKDDSRTKKQAPNSEFAVS
jgi:hypothetical protein